MLPFYYIEKVGFWLLLQRQIAGQLTIWCWKLWLISFGIIDNLWFNELRIGFGCPTRQGTTRLWMDQTKWSCLDSIVWLLKAWFFLAFMSGESFCCFINFTCPICIPLIQNYSVFGQQNLVPLGSNFMRMSLGPASSSTRIRISLC